MATFALDEVAPVSTWSLDEVGPPTPQTPEFDAASAAQPQPVSQEDKDIAFSKWYVPPPEFTQSLLGEDVAMPPSLRPKSYNIPSLTATMPETDQPSKAMIPVESVGKVLGGVIDWATSPKGLIEQALALTPAAPAVMLKWATDMVRSGKES